MQACVDVPILINDHVLGVFEVFFPAYVLCFFQPVKGDVEGGEELVIGGIGRVGLSAIFGGCVESVEKGENDEKEEDFDLHVIWISE